MSNQPKKSGKHPNVALRYTGMAFQMAAIIGLGVFIGTKLDARFQFEKNYMTALCAVLSLGVALYLTLKDVNRK